MNGYDPQSAKIISHIPKFNRFILIGESIRWKKDGFEIRATIEFDQQAHPRHYDCYDERDIERWRDDQWFFAGLVISVWKAGVCLEDHVDSLWGIAIMDVDDTDRDYLQQLCDDYEAAAVRQGRYVLEKLKAA